MQYYVSRKEIWEQIVRVDADTEDEARLKAEAGDVIINSDPQYERPHNVEAWVVEAVPEEE